MTTRNSLIFLAFCLMLSDGAVADGPWHAADQNTAGWQFMTPNERVEHQRRMRSFERYEDFLAPSRPVAPVSASAALAEISSHNREDDCRLAIEGRIYDITPYLPDHPTEPEVILPWCGKEATQAWLTKNKDRPHSPRANQLLEKYRAGNRLKAE